MNEEPIGNAERGHEGYATARQHRLARTRNPILNEYRWRLMAFGCLAGLLIAMPAAFFFALRNQVQLKIVQVDEHNRVLSVGGPELPVDRQVLGIKASLVQVIEWVRTVPGDVDLLKANWYRAMQYMTPEGAEMLKQHGREMKPDQLAKDWRVRVKVLYAPQPVTASSYLVAWEERFYRLPEMTHKKTQRYESVISFVLQPPEAETEEARLNWLGVKIYDAHWYPQPELLQRPGAPKPTPAVGRP